MLGQQTFILACVLITGAFAARRDAARVKVELNQATGLPEPDLDFEAAVEQVYLAHDKEVIELEEAHDAEVNELEEEIAHLKHEASVNTTGPSFSKISSEDEMPPGWQLATKEAVEEHKDEVVALIDPWEICALAGGFKINGTGYGSQIQEDGLEKKIQEDGGHTFGHLIIMLPAAKSDVGEVSLHTIASFQKVVITVGTAVANSGEVEMVKANAEGPEVSVMQMKPAVVHRATSQAKNVFTADEWLEYLQADYCGGLNCKQYSPTIAAFVECLNEASAQQDWKEAPGVEDEWVQSLWKMNSAMCFENPNNRDYYPDSVPAEIARLEQAQEEAEQTSKKCERDVQACCSEAVMQKAQNTGGMTVADTAEKERKLQGLQDEKARIMGEYERARQTIEDSESMKNAYYSRKMELLKEALEAALN